MSKFKYTVDFEDLKKNTSHDLSEDPIDPDTVLRGWHTLHYFYKLLSLNDCITLLKMEIEGADRELLVTRLMSRIRKLISYDMEELLNDFANKIRQETKLERNSSRTVLVQKGKGTRGDTI